VNSSTSSFKTGGFSRYLASLLGLMALLVLLNIVFNLIVDPLNTWHIVKLDGFNAVKNRAYKYERIAKPLMVERMQPQRVFIGTSRTEYSLSGASPALPQQPPMTALNLGMRAANIKEIQLMLQHALLQAPVREAVIGLETHAFNRSAGRPTELDNYVVRDWLGDKNPGYRLYQFRDTLLAMDVSSASVKTLERQTEDDRKMAEDGRFLAEKNIPAILESGGYRYSFDYWISEIIEGASSLCQPGIYGAGDVAIARFRDTLEIAAKADIDLKLFISPSHVSLLYAHQIQGTWAGSERWKRAMVTAVDEVNREYGTTYKIIDFETVNPLTTETIPAVGDQTSTMQYFFDPAHFSMATGDKILGRLYDTDDADWGVELNLDKLDEQLQQLRQSVARWAQQNPDEQAYVKSITDRHADRRCR
jgi:hypothetical protein